MSIRPFVRAAAALAAGLTMVLMVAAPSQARPRPDRTPPTTPTNLRVTAVTHTSVTLAWNPSTDNVGVVSYSLWGEGLSGVVSVRHPQTTATWTGLRPGQTVTFRVRAFDAAFNGSADSNPVTVTTTRDTTAPTAPTGLTVQSATAGTVQVQFTAGSDDFGPVTHRVLVNGAVTRDADWLVAEGTFPRPSVQGFSVRQLEPGTTYQLAVRAVDGAGNVSGLSNTVTATTAASTDTTPPTTPTLVSVSGGGTGICPEELWLRWTGSTDDRDAATAIEYEIRVNGVINEVAVGSTRWVAYTEVLGANEVTIVAVDAAGNASAPSNALTTRTNWGFGCGT